MTGYAELTFFFEVGLVSAVATSTWVERFLGHLEGRREAGRCNLQFH